MDADILTFAGWFFLSMPIVAFIVAKVVLDLLCGKD